MVISFGVRINALPSVRSPGSVPTEGLSPELGGRPGGAPGGGGGGLGDDSADSGAGADRVGGITGIGMPNMDDASVHQSVGAGLALGLRLGLI